MTDSDLIDKVAELWDRAGGDVDGFWMSVRRIADAIDELKDRRVLVCECGASRDPGSCGHHPLCPMKAIEG